MVNTNKITAMWEEAQFEANRVGCGAYFLLAQKIMDKCCQALCEYCKEGEPTRWHSGNWMHGSDGSLPGVFYIKCEASAIYEVLQK